LLSLNFLTDEGTLSAARPSRVPAQFVGLGGWPTLRFLKGGITISWNLRCPCRRWAGGALKPGFGL